ncbi:tetratricopeptide repeat protein [Mycolicibacterium sp. Y3]
MAEALYQELDRLLGDEHRRAELVGYYERQMGNTWTPPSALDGRAADSREPAHTDVLTDLVAVTDVRDLVDLFGHNGFLTAADMNPYVLRATESKYGDRRHHGIDDPYVARTRNKFDETLANALKTRGFTLIIGPSNAGKTRSAFHGVASALPDSGIVVPVPGRLSELAAHPLVRNTDAPLVVWLDDLDRYLRPTDPLTPSLLDKLLSRPGRTNVLGTLRSEQRAFLLGDQLSVKGLNHIRGAGLPPGSLGADDRSSGAPYWIEEFASNGAKYCRHEPADDDIRHIRQVLHSAFCIDLDHTTQDPIEQQAAAANYPHEELGQFGLGAQLGCGPDLLRFYRDAEHWEQPLLHAVLRAAIDWSRCGRQDPIPESALIEAAEHELRLFRSDVHATRELMLKAVGQARTPRPGDGKAATLTSHFLADGTRGYKPYDYLVSADDEQSCQRPIADRRWDDALYSADAAAAYGVMLTAYHRGQARTAVRLGRQAAKLGSAEAAYLMGYLYETAIEPRNPDAALRWYRKGANAGYLPAQLRTAWALSQENDATLLADAQRLYATASRSGDRSAKHHYANFLLSKVKPPRRDEAIELLEDCANQNDLWAMNHLGSILADSEPPNLEQAVHWLTKAATECVTEDNIAVVNASRIRLGYIAAHAMDPPQIQVAQKWFRAADADGDPGGLVGLADIAANHRKRPDLKKADELFREAANTGDVYAMCSYGRFLLDNFGAATNDDAIHWLEKASKHGDRTAKYYLGCFFIKHGEGERLADGAAYLREAAEAGLVEAMCHLGDLYREDDPAVATAPLQQKKSRWRQMREWFASLDSHKSLKSAIYWYTQAAENGHIHAMVALSAVYWADFDPPALKPAREWLERAAHAGESVAMRSLGDLLSVLWSPPDIDAAISWYKAAADQDDVDAMQRLGDLMQATAPQEACYWYERAAELGDLESMIVLADMLLETFNDPQEALTWYRRAARKNDPRAMLGAADVLRNHLNPPETREADRWRRRASELSR